jgi:hypothetical protein
MVVPTRARRSPSSTPTVALLSLFYFLTGSMRSLSLSDFKQLSSAAMADLSFNLKLSPLFNLKLSFPFDFL